MSLKELIPAATLGFAIGLYPGIEHARTFRRIERRWNPSEKAEFLGEQISQAKRLVDIVSEDLNPFVFNPLVPLISHQLEMKPKLRVRFIVSPHIAGLRTNFSESCENRLYNLAMTRQFGNQLQMKVVKDLQEPYFGVIDISHIYVEKPQDLKGLRRDVIIYKNSAIGVAELQSKFEEMWESLEEIPPEEVTVVSHRLETTNPEEARRILREVKALPILQHFNTLEMEDPLHLG